MKVCLSCDARHEADTWRCTACGYTPPILDGFPAFAPELAHAGAGFNPELHADFARLEAGHFWFRSRNRLIIEEMQRHFPTCGAYLEIGCGTGYVLSGIAAAFPAAYCVGTEIYSTGLLHAAERLPKAELLQADARRLPYADHFDVIGAFDVIEHIEEDVDVLAGMHRALKPGGGLLVTVPQHQWLWSRQDEAACHVRRYSADELRRKVTVAGFSILEMRSFVSLLLPAMYLSRLAHRHGRAEEHDTFAEMRIHPLVNGIFAGAMSVERILMKLGMNFPAGGSLLLVAHKE